MSQEVLAQHHAGAQNAAAPITQLDPIHAPWTVIVDEVLSDEELTFVRDTFEDDSARYCRVLNAKGEGVSRGWANPRLFKLIAAAPAMRDLLEQLIELERDGRIQDIVVTHNGTRKWVIQDLAADLLGSTK